MVRLLVRIDDGALREPLRAAAPEGAAVVEVSLADLAEARGDVVVAELDALPVETVADLTRRRPDLPVVVLSPLGRMDAAVRALKAGANDVVLLPADPALLAVSLQRAVEHRRMVRELMRLRRQGRDAGGLVGRSAPMERLRELVARMARVDSSVLVVGESGTGKELVARALHAQGPRARGPFVAINCAAVPEALLESELFGHVRGAFTDARQARAGLFVQAAGGTLFLDEVGDLPLGLQPKLLRVLQERRVRPLGAEAEIPVDVRIVAATHRDLEARVAEGRFREDLLYRLDVMRLELPALRERGTDVLALAQHFLAVHAARMDRPTPTLGPDVARALLAHRWPGNVRELQNAMERAVALADAEALSLADLPPRLQAEGAPARTPDDPESLPTLDEVERQHVGRVLAATGGHRGNASRILGIDRKTLWRKLAAWGLDG